MNSQNAAWGEICLFLFSISQNVAQENDRGSEEADFGGLCICAVLFLTI
jgi:hypothetical protein